MYKEDLKFGNVVETRDGEKYIFNYVGDETYFIRLDGAGFNPSKYYKDDLSIDDSNRESDIVKVYKDYTLKELLWERKPELTDVEKMILKNLDKRFKYIARDDKGNVYVEDDYISTAYIEAFNHLFQFIDDNEKEYLIEDLLKGHENDDNNRK